MRTWVESIAKGKFRPQPALGDSGQKMDDKYEYCPHSHEDWGNGDAGRKIVY
jgi:hypothetical protein